MSYDTTVEGYLKRCKERRDSGSLQDLLYAALELRMGVEARLVETVQAIDGLTVAQRRQWKVVHLAKTLQAVNWSNGDDILVMLCHLREPDETLELHYFPVTSRLTEIVGRLGDFLHRNERIVSDQTAVHRELSALVRDGYGQLLMANSGELLGLPQIDPKTGSLNVILKLQDDDPRAAVLQKAFTSGRKYSINWVAITPVGPAMFYDAVPSAAAVDSNSPSASSQ